MSVHMTIKDILFSAFPLGNGATNLQVGVLLALTGVTLALVVRYMIPDMVRTWRKINTESED